MREVPYVLGAEGVFQEKKPKVLKILRQLDRQNRRDALVNVVQQLDFVAKLFAALLKQAQRPA